METLFVHLTKKSAQGTTDENGRKIRSRDIFDIERSKRLHWIWHHIQELKNDLKIFSNKERKDGRDVVRTYIYDEAEEYVNNLTIKRN